MPVLRFFRKYQIFIIVGGVTLLLQLLFMFHLNKLQTEEEESGRRWLANVRQKAPAVVEFGTKNFALLDTDADGIIRLNELHEAHSKQSFSKAERELIQHMMLNTHVIGHQVGTRNQGKFTQAVYGISQSDLSSYLQHLEKRYPGVP